MANLNITNIPAPRVPFIDERTGLMAREWYRFFLNLFVLTGSGNNPITLEELQLGPPNQPDLTELLIQINQNIAPQYEDQSGDFLATLDTAQLMSMMSRFENAEAAIQGAYLQPVVQTGTIASYNLDGSPTAGGIAYGTGPALAVSAAGSSGQVLTSAGAGTPTWATPTTGTVTSVSVVSANGLAGTVATATTTPAITLSTTVTGLLKGNGTAISAATSGTDYAPATSGTSILYGNGAGGFNNVTIGTGVAFATGTLSATGSGGTVTSVGFTGGIITVANPTTTPAFTIAGTSGGIPYFSSASTWATSAALAAGSLVLGGGAGVTPATTTTGTGVVTALGVNTGTAGAFVVNGGALGTPSSGTVTNLTGTASININGTVGATTPAAVTATTIAGTDTTDASSTTAAAFKTAGGLAVVKKIYVGDNVVIATSGKGVTTGSAIPLGLGTNGSTTQAILDATGNLGVGVTPRKLLSVGAYLDLYSGAAATPTVPSIRASIGNNLILNAFSTGITYINFDGGSGGAIIANGAGGSLVTVASTGNTTLNTGNIIQGTAAKGFDFSANTPLAGKTSTLLNWYEEGTWTPNQGAGLSLVGAFSSTGRYTRIGRQVSISGTVTGATSVAITAAGVVTSNLPFTVGTAGHGNATNVAINASATVICTGTSVTSAAAIAATATITFSATYFV